MAKNMNKEHLEQLLKNPLLLKEYLEDQTITKGSGEGFPEPVKQEKYPNLNRGGNTPDNRYGAGRRRNQIRELMQHGLLNEVLPLMALLIQKAQKDELKATEVIKLFDVFAKYGLGPALPEDKQDTEEEEVKVIITFD